MRRILSIFLLWTVVLCACVPGRLSTEESQPALPATLPVDSTVSTPPVEAATEELFPALTSEVLPGPKLIATVSTPHIDQGPDGANTAVSSYPQDCGYQWAQQAMPELSSSFQASIQELQAAAQASAFAFGEDCVHADGTKTFLPMETDFNVTVQVNDLSDESALGDWILKVMQVIENIPTDQILGPRPGRVAIGFQSNGEDQFVSFYIDQYRALAAGLSSAEIYQTLKNLP
jgi:hypothetical protein